LELQLDAVERRVLGALMEKDITTPDYYPLTLNALLAACNQKSNREPVMELDEPSVRGALDSLGDKGMAGEARSEGRVQRFEHRLSELWNLGRRESAVLCTLLLRGPQTPGELRGRSERMHRIEDLDEMQLVLQKLMDHSPSLAMLLPRQPGTKESRYADCLGGADAATSDAPSAQAFTASSAGGASENAERIRALEDEVARLRAEVDSLRRRFEEFRAQFES
jgi:uncharacterized protein